MIAAFSFVGITLLLLIEGALATRFILKSSDRLLLLSLALPFSAFFNVLLVFLWTVLHVPLNGWSLLIPHLLLTVALYLLNKKFAAPRTLSGAGVQSFQPIIENKAHTILEKTLMVTCSALIMCTAIYSFAHAVLLPTFQYDSATNWTMRSEISFYDHAIAFDPDESRGMAKPQYPFLFHALQITVNQRQEGFHDTAANAILWLLSLGSFSALFLILKKFTGLFMATLTLTMLLGIPMLSLHLGQGYADITLTQELLLSMVCLLAWIRSRENPWLLASAVLVASSVWTKSEGLFFGLIPWLIAVAFIMRTDELAWNRPLKAMALAIGLSIPWPIFATFKGLLLTPHSGDTRFGFHSEGLHEAFAGLFDRGSFGIAWYVLIAGIIWMLIEARQAASKPRRSELALLLFGGIVFAEILFIYLFTPNVQFLLNAESYYRQMMVPGAMLMLACVVWFGKIEKK